VKWRSRQLAALGLLGIALLVCATAAAGQGFGRRSWREALGLDRDARVAYDGRFAFSRLRHTVGMGGGGRGEPPWAHDYPRAERNFTRILKDVTFVTPHLDESNIFTMDDPELFTSPIAYMSEPGFWLMTDEELDGMQQFVKKGGFIIFDDFRGTQHWSNFAEQVQRIIPNGKLVQLDSSHPIFHSFFDIDVTDAVGYYGPATFHGVFENNDPDRRLLLIANYNHDLGEMWEYSDTGFVPVDLSNDAYKFGINYVVYALTH
jgi:hypothetical protein